MMNDDMYVFAQLHGLMVKNEFMQSIESSKKSSTQTHTSLGNQTYTKSCSIHNRIEYPSLRGMA